MSQIDYVLGFADLATAKADPTVVNHYNAVAADWAADHAMVVQLTRISTGLPVAGFFVLVSTSQPVPALLNHSALKLAIDRDKAAARQAGAVLRQTVGGAVLQDVIFDRVFAGSDYPWGGFT